MTNVYTHATGLIATNYANIQGRVHRPYSSMLRNKKQLSVLRMLHAFQTKQFTTTNLPMSFHSNSKVLKQKPIISLPITSTTYYNSAPFLANFFRSQTIFRSRNSEKLMDVNEWAFSKRDKFILCFTFHTCIFHLDTHTTHTAHKAHMLFKWPLCMRYHPIVLLRVNLCGRQFCV